MIFQEHLTENEASGCKNTSVYINVQGKTSLGSLVIGLQ